MVALNFGDEEQTVPFAFPVSGDYREELHGADGLLTRGEPGEALDLHGVADGVDTWLTIPSNYGRIWTARRL